MEKEINIIITHMSIDKDCCPICGYQFDTVNFNDINICPTEHYHNELLADQLISSDDDYEWCL